MRRDIFIYILLLTVGGDMFAQSSQIEQVLRSIETNNKELQANAQLVASQKMEAKAENNLADPSLSYAHLWGSKDKSETIGELVISQSFDFPTLYFTRNKLNRLKSGTYDGQADVVRQTMLLQAKELCLDIVMLRQQKKILDERLRNAEELAAIYNHRLQIGETNSLEVNKINLELLNVKTEATLNQTTLQNKLQALRALNGNIPVSFEDMQYPVVPFPSDYQALKTEVMGADRNLLALANESLVAHKQISVNKSQWLPKLELGYRRNTESGLPFNGVVVGFSFPLFENRNKTKIAKAQALNVDLRRESAGLQAEAELEQLYQEAKSLYASMTEYQDTFRTQQDIEYLRQALAGGEISMIEFFVEVSVIYQVQLNYLQLENQYQKAMAKIYKGKL